MNVDTRVVRGRLQQPRVWLSSHPGFQALALRLAGGIG
jgi:hypothetical protein